MKKLILFSLMTLSCWGQQNLSEIQFTTNPPTSATSITTNLVGLNPGLSQYYYWIIANFPIGQGITPSYVLSNNVPSRSSYSSGHQVNINWNSLVGATTYDILVTTTPTLPTTCTCSLATGLTTTTYTDIGGSLSSYTFSPASTAIGTMRLDNVSTSSPSFVITPPISGGSGVSEVDTTAPILGGPITTTGTISCRGANGSQSGCLSSTDWNTFNNKQGGISLTTTGTTGAATFGGNIINVPVYQGALTLTTTGSSGASTLSGNTLNIPQYSGGGGSGTVTSITATSPLTGGTITTSGSIGITQSGASSNGYLSSIDWNTFNNKAASNASTTVNGQTCALGSTCTVTSAPSGSAGGDLGGSYPNPTVGNLSNVSNSSLANNGLAHPAMTVNSQTCTLGASCTVIANSPTPTIANTQNYYISPSGNDSNNCSSGSKCLTLAHVLSLVPSLITQQYIINVAHGTYAEPINTTGFIGYMGGSVGITILGDTGSPGSVIFSGTTTCGVGGNQYTTEACISGPVAVTLSGVTVSASSARDEVYCDWCYLTITDSVITGGGASSSTLECIDSYHGMILSQNAVTCSGFNATTGLGVYLAQQTLMVLQSGTLTITGSGGSSNTSWCLNPEFNSTFTILPPAGTNPDLIISGCQYGIGATSGSQVNSFVSSGTISITNGSTTPATSYGLYASSGAQINFTTQTGPGPTLLVDHFTTCLYSTGEGMILSGPGNRTTTNCVANNLVNTQNVVTGSRSFGTVFQNTSDSSYLITVTDLASAVGGNVQAYSDTSNPPTGNLVAGLTVPNTALSAYEPITFMVPSGYFYEVTNSGTGTIGVWTEWGITDGTATRQGGHMVLF